MLNFKQDIVNCKYLIIDYFKNINKCVIYEKISV